MIDTILKRWNIPPEDWANFRSLVEGKISSERFGIRLAERYNYHGATEDILRELSRPYAHLYKQNEPTR